MKLSNSIDKRFNVMLPGSQLGSGIFAACSGAEIRKGWMLLFLLECQIPFWILDKICRVLDLIRIQRIVSRSWRELGGRVTATVSA